MFRSLRIKLILTIVTVAAIAVAAVGFFSSRAVSFQLERLLSADAETNLEHFSSILEEHYRQHGDWIGVEPVLDRIGSGGAKQLSLLDGGGNVVAVSPSRLRQGSARIDNDFTFHWRQEQVKDKDGSGSSNGDKRSVYQYEIAEVPHKLLTDENGVSIGTLCLIPAVELTASAASAVQFTDSVNQSLFLAALTSAAIAAIFAVFLARRIVKPVEELTVAARRMETGNLSQQVIINSNDEIGNLARSFNSMAKNLAFFEQQRREMLGDIAHELRTPLTSVRCQIEAVRDGLEIPTPEVVESLYEEVLLLNRLMDDLQEIALADASGLRLNKELFSLSDEINRAINALKHQTEAKHLSIVTDLQTGMPAVYGDAQRIGQAIKNILQNSIKYTPLRGKITITSKLQDSDLELAIADTGAGIAPADLPFVFDRFYRADPSRTRATGGFGLGLAIVKQIIEAHGGSARIESSDDDGNRGTLVYLTIPTSGIS